MESGKTYSLSEIFNKNKRIIIPDLQRDYCWGVKEKDPDLVSNFFDSLIDLYEKGDGCYKQISLGLIYAYENPNNFVNIADGQQRITTIYLLLCLIARKLKNGDRKVIENFLVLDNSKNIKEPRLRYEVRESTIYFIKDFINKEIFEKNTEKLTENYIKESNWYRDEYKNDPSINSMLKAIQKMEEKINSNSFSLVDFAFFLLGINSSDIDQEIKNELQNMKIAEHIPKDSNAVSRIYQGYGISFVYFDVENREFGEKMYVILNTRGAPMEPNEHIKPLLLEKISVNDDKIKWAEKWEDWQDFFWQNKNKNDESADDGFNEFLIWYVKIQEKKDIQKKEKYKYFTDNKTENELPNIQKYFQALETLLGYLNDENDEKDKKDKKFQNIFNQINSVGNNQKFNLTYLRNLKDLKINNILIPLLAFMVKFKDDKDGAYRFLRRLRKNYFHKENDGRVRTGKYVDWHYILKIIEYSDNLKSLLEFSDFTNFENISDKNKTPEVKDWYDDEEKIKDELKKKNEETKKTIEKWEDENDFAGDVTPLLQIYLHDLNSKEISQTIKVELKDIEKIERLFNIYCELELLMIKNKNEENNNIANWYRLYKILIDANPIGGFSGVNDGLIGGVAFSKKNLIHLNNKEYHSFLKQIYLTVDWKNEALILCKSKAKAESFDDENFYAYKTVRCWLILKVLHAEKNKSLLSYDDGKTGISAFGDKEKNRLFLNIKFDSKYNILCGFAVKYNRYFKYFFTNDKQKISERLDAPIIPNELWYDDNFKDYYNSRIDKNEIKEIDKYIKEIKKYINELLEKLN